MARIRKLRRDLLAAVLALPAVFLNFWNNRSGGPPGCELASPLTCVAFVVRLWHRASWRRAYLHFQRTSIRTLVAAGAD